MLALRLLPTPPYDALRAADALHVVSCYFDVYLAVRKGAVMGDDTGQRLARLRDRLRGQWEQSPLEGVEA